MRERSKLRLVKLSLGQDYTRGQKNLPIPSYSVDACHAATLFSDPRGIRHLAQRVLSACELEWASFRRTAGWSLRTQCGPTRRAFSTRLRAAPGHVQNAYRR